MSIFQDHNGRYGYRRITATLKNSGIVINQKKVRRIMRKLELKCIAFSRKSRKYNSYKGTCLDNSPMENFFSIMKQEMYYRKTYKSFNELEKAITEYIYYYNNKRIKEKLNWRSPVKYRFEYESKVT